MHEAFTSNERGLKKGMEKSFKNSYIQQLISHLYEKNCTQETDFTVPGNEMSFFKM